MKSRPAQAYCQLCERLFCYFRTTKPRILCSPCVKIEARLHTFFLRERRAVLKAERVA